MEELYIEIYGESLGRVKENLSQFNSLMELKEEL